MQEHWNVLENVIIDCIDSLAPLEYHSHEGHKPGIRTPKNVKNLINVRNRLLKIDRKRNNCFNAPRIKKLNLEIKAYFKNSRASRVRQAATGGNVNFYLNNMHFTRE